MNNSKTRWLTLLPAVERILQLFLPLKSYFLSAEKCPIYTQNFFENDILENLFTAKRLYFMSVLKKIEGDKVTAMQVSNTIRDLCKKLETRLNESFVPLIIRHELTKLVEEGLIDKN